jgi:hypothetical protein
MKLFSTLFILIALTACGKKAEFDGRNAGPTNPVGSDPVTLDATYKRTEPMNANVTYTTNPATLQKERNGGQENSLSIRNEGFKVPQEISVTKGWASHSTTAQITIVATGLEDIVCTYTSQATGTQTAAVPLMEAEYSEKGQSYKFSNCTDTSVDSTVILDGYDYVVLRVNSASNLEPETKVQAQIKIYE